MSGTHTLKRGTTLSLAGLVALPPGAWAAACSVKDTADAFADSLQCTLQALPRPDAKGYTHTLLLEATPAQTATWAAERMQADIKFTDASSTPAVVIASATWFLQINPLVST